MCKYKMNADSIKRGGQLYIIKIYRISIKRLVLSKIIQNKYVLTYKNGC